MAENQTSMTRREGRGMARPLFGSAGGPFAALQRFAEDVDRMFDEFGMSGGWSPSLGTRAFGRAHWAPAVDVVQKDDRLLIKADVPGMTKDDLSIEVAEDAITIEGERKSDREEEGGGVYRSERTYGRFTRMIPLPEGAVTEQAKASFRDGVLEISVPVPPASVKSRKLEISETEQPGSRKK